MAQDQLDFCAPLLIRRAGSFHSYSKILGTVGGKNKETHFLFKNDFIWKSSRGLKGQFGVRTLVGVRLLGIT